jgi:hypothetical protein
VAVSALIAFVRARRATAARGGSSKMQPTSMRASGEVESGVDLSTGLADGGVERWGDGVRLGGSIFSSSLRGCPRPRRSAIRRRGVVARARRPVGVRVDEKAHPVPQLQSIIVDSSHHRRRVDSA